MKYRKGYKYQLAATEYFSTPCCPVTAVHTDFISLTVNGNMTVRSGYAWDGASGPTWDTKSSMRGSLAHDALYQLMRQGQLPMACRGDADFYMGQLMKEDRMWHWRANLWVRELGKFGKGAAHPENVKEVFEAP